jgi:nucleoid-associated protein YgaU
MGKHDRPRNRGADEDREAQGFREHERDREERTDDEDASGEGREPASEGSSAEGGLRVGKEIKIGVAVVVGLLMVLGIVLWSQVRRTAGDPAPSKEGPKVATTEKDKTASPAGDSAFASNKAKQLTVTDALSGQAASAKKTRDGFPDWNAPDSGRDRRDDERAKPASPNYMSNPAAFTPAQRPASSPAVPSPPAWQTEPAGAAAVAGDPRPADPFGKQPSAIRVDVAPAASPAAAPNPLRGSEAFSPRTDVSAAPRTAVPSSIIGPPPATGAAAQPRAPGSKVYVVQEGDTLYDIARSELGKASRWGEIYDLNRDALGARLDALSPGMQLTLPEDRLSRPASVAERPGATFQR